MHTTKKDMKISELCELFEADMMKANSEYQRGIVWNESQQKKLIDSLMRGYTLPLIYLHDKREEVAGRVVEKLEIIDGQQRLTALNNYNEGAFRLFDPYKENDKAKFPRFLLDQECPWAGKYFYELPTELQTKFRETTLLIAMIDSNDTNEIRDLFIRLQAGSTLNAQEKRDALPGGMNEFILRLGGKPQIPRYPGHDFFREAMSARPASDRGKTRQLAAQITLLLQAQRNTFGQDLPDINAAAIDQLYYENLDFDSNGSEARRITQTFDILNKLLKDGMRPRLRAHDVIHASLLVDRLRDEFTPAWETEFPNALDVFLENLRGADKAEDSDPKYQYWSRYGQWTRANSDRGENISKRHAFYANEMLTNMPSTSRKDPQREFPPEMRELIYFMQGKKCAVCEGAVAWSEIEIHHVRPHHEGGKTELENAALVHKDCHPKTIDAVEKFAQSWFHKDKQRQST